MPNPTPKRYTVTAALPYANGPLHIGHLAGAYLGPDVYCRYLRLRGREVLFICGSDEHGAAITMRAKKEGITPQEIIDKYHALFEATFRRIGIAFDVYHRTSAALHHETAQGFFRQLYQNGQFAEQTSEQYYDEAAQQFLADRYIMGTCPVCAHPDAYGDQCENCGSTLSPTELKDPRSTLSGERPVLKATSHWYLKLDEYEGWLRDWIETGRLDGQPHHEPAEWKGHVLGQCKSWLDGGLQPRAMTRDLEWGVDVPADVPHAEGKKLYVWMDAPIGYVSATKHWAEQRGEAWEKWWKDPESRLIHFIGKDNIVFHCIIFPAILKAHGGFNLPHNVPANQFMNLEGKKISTSRNWAIWVHEYLDEFEGREDELRYYMIKNMPEQRDSEFTWRGFQEANNAELVGNLAGFIHRTVTLVNKYFEGAVPDWRPAAEIKASQEGDTLSGPELMAELGGRMAQVAGHIEAFEFRAALQEVMEISSRGNQLLGFNEPWKLAKTDLQATADVLGICLQYVRALSVVAAPFLPFTAARLAAILRVEGAAAGAWENSYDTLRQGQPLLPEGHRIAAPQHLFARLDDAVVAAQIAKLEASQATAATAQAPAYEPAKPDIGFEDFSKIDLRTGTIVAAEKVKKTKKLLHLQVDLGAERRSIVSGIAEYYAPEDIIGQEVVVVANLAPRELKGILSQGMILMAENAQGELRFVQPKGGFGSGWVVR